MARKIRIELTLDDLLTDCTLGLEARNSAAETVTIYRLAVSQFIDHLRDGGHSLAAGAVEKRDIQAWLRDLLERPSERTGRPLSPTTVDIRFRTLRAFWNWAADAGHVPVSPMKGLQRPRLPSAPKPHYDEDELAALLEACRGGEFDEVRDMAIVRFFVGTGCRLGEVAGLDVSDIDLTHRRALVTGKGARSRTVRLGPRTAQAMHRYLLLRPRHAHASSSALWLGTRGPLTSGGLTLMLARRGRQAGVQGVTAHKFRHTFAHHWRRHGGSVVDLEILLGWCPNSPMSRHYGASALAEVALEHADQFSLGESL